MEMPSLQQQTKADLEMMEWQVMLKTNRRLSSSAFYSLLVAYAVIVIFGILANALIIILILRQRSRSFL